MTMTVKTSAFEKFVDYDTDPCPLADDHPDRPGVESGDLAVYYCQARVCLDIPMGNDATISQWIESPGLFGITARYDDDPYFDDVFDEESETLAAMLRAMGIEVVDDRPAPVGAESHGG